MFLGLPQMFGAVGYWPYLYVVEVGVTLVQIIGLTFFAPDSPTFLIVQGREAEAMLSLRVYVSTVYSHTIYPFAVSAARTFAYRHILRTFVKR
jgi:hypothetical protein